MAENEKNMPEGAKIYELVISFVQPEKAMVRIAAATPEMAEAALTEMVGNVVRDLKVESVQEVPADAPIPEDYEESDAPGENDDEAPVLDTPKTTVH